MEEDAGSLRADGSAPSDNDVIDIELDTSDVTHSEDDVKSSSSRDDIAPSETGSEYGKTQPGFSIQEILSPSFGHRSVQSRYCAAYLNYYYYSLQMQQLMLLRNATSLAGAPAGALLSHAQTTHGATVGRDSHISDVTVSSEKHRTDTRAASRSGDMKNSHSTSRDDVTNRRIALPTQAPRTIQHDDAMTSRIAQRSTCDDDVTSESSDASSTRVSRDVTSSSLHNSSLSPEATDVTRVGEQVSAGAQKMQEGGRWPAWVYCTRYSDRPSSGEFTQMYAYFIYNYTSM